MPDKTLEKEALDQYLSGGRKVSSVVTQVTNGKNAMPASVSYTHLTLPTKA